MPRIQPPPTSSLAAQTAHQRRRPDRRGHAPGAAPPAHVSRPPGAPLIRCRHVSPASSTNACHAMSRPSITRRHRRGGILRVAAARTGDVGRTLSISRSGERTSNAALTGAVAYCLDSPYAIERLAAQSAHQQRRADRGRRMVPRRVPPAPLPSTRCQPINPASSTSACHAVSPTTGNAAASASSMLEGAAARRADIGRTPSIVSQRRAHQQRRADRRGRILPRQSVRHRTSRSAERAPATPR
jgi:hypothetical protein